MNEITFKKLTKEINNYICETINHTAEIPTKEEVIYNFLIDELDSMKLFYKDIYFC